MQIEKIKLQILSNYLRNFLDYLKRRFKGPLYIYILIIFFIVISFPIVLFVRLIRPFYLIRIGGLWNQHIGHYAMCTELYLCNTDLVKKKNKTIDLFYLRSGVNSNNYLTLMWKRKLIILPSLPLKAISILNYIIPGGKIHDIGLPAFDRDINSILDKTTIHLKFTYEEVQLGEKLIKELGVLNNAPFVCFLVRDDAYYNDSYKFTNYRNANINNYLLAAEFLTQNGYYVLRMGAKVKNAFNTNGNKMIIDYAFSGKRTEFMDIYLASRCEFCVTTGSGWDNLANIFRRPIVYTNLLPIADFPSSSERFINIPKSLISQTDEHHLSLNEIISKDLLSTRDLQDYEKKGVKYIENTPEEIKDIVIEMHDRINNFFIETNEDNLLQLKFWKLIIDNNPKDKSGILMHILPKGRIGNKFLKNNPSWLN